MAKLSSDKTYVIVERGDTLSAIALTYLGSASKYKTLAAINGISNPNRISVGQKIYLKKTSSSSSSSSSSSTSKNKKSSNMAKIKQFGLQADLDNTLFATWTWDKDHTDNYKVEWQYYTKDKYWFVGDDSTTKYKYSTFSIPSNATRVRFRVKPIAKKHTVKKKVQTKVNGKTVSTTKSTEEYYWTAQWTDRNKKIYNVKIEPPEKPTSAPSVEIKGTKLTAKLENLDSKITSCEFQVVKDDKKTVKTGTAKTSKQSVKYSCTIDLGGEYKVRYRAIDKNKLKSEWSDYSNNIGTAPYAPKSITSIVAKTSTEIQLVWTKVSNAKGYTVEYTTLQRYFDSSNNVSSISVEGKNHAEVTGLTSGTKYYFRVKAINDNGESGWCPIKEGIVGRKPEAPTTWSSTTTAMAGEDITLYWVHNSVDGSSQTYAQVQMSVYNHFEDVKVYDKTIKNTTDEYEKDKTSSIKVQDVLNETIEFLEGTKLKWRVRTKGVLDQWSDWSIQREIDIYIKPNLELTLYRIMYPIYTLTTEEPFDWSTNYTSYYTRSGDNYISVTGDTAPTWESLTYYSVDSLEYPFEDLDSFPFYISGIAGPTTQTPISYNLTVVANETYETVDNIGNLKIVKEGDEVYSKNFDTSDPLLVEMSAGNIDLENGMSYTVNCIVSMNSGLTAESSANFTVSWVETDYSPNAEISIDDDIFSATIRPYCEETRLEYYEVSNTDGTYVKTDSLIEDELYGEDLGVKTTTGESVFSGSTAEGIELYYCIVSETVLVDNLTLSVYRREFDGKYTEIASGLDNTGNISVTDPHPALDYARYRIVATDANTGAVGYYDMPSEPVGGKSIIIQWDEEWSTFDTSDNENATDLPVWTGSLLSLPYNIDVSDKYDSDVEFVEYIGREHPVTYYGTQKGESSTWKVDIEKDDEETLYSLRRLAKWSGDVYVREPSGSGYWANVKVSFSQTHKELTIPVNLSITRVEGGI